MNKKKKKNKNKKNNNKNKNKNKKNKNKKNKNKKNKNNNLNNLNNNNLNNNNLNNNNNNNLNNNNNSSNNNNNNKANNQVRTAVGELEELVAGGKRLRGGHVKTSSLDERNKPNANKRGKQCGFVSVHKLLPNKNKQASHTLIWPVLSAVTRASWSTHAPRAVLTKMALDFIFSNVSALKMLVVSGVSAHVAITMSLSFSSVSISTARLPMCMCACVHVRDGE